MLAYTKEITQKSVTERYFKDPPNTSKSLMAQKGRPNIFNYINIETQCIRTCGMQLNQSFRGKFIVLNAYVIKWRMGLINT